MNLGHKLNRVSVSSFFVVLLLSLGATSAWPQSATGSISGQVTDQQSATIAGAAVKLVDVSTNSSQSSTTNDVGRYNFISVIPGVYNLTVSHPGFTQAKLQGQKVEVGMALTLNITLELGSPPPIVEVKAAAGAELQTLNATIGTTISNEQLNLLPDRKSTRLNFSHLVISYAVFCL